MNTPNLFKYATSELSQDAIICYILEWAKIENKKLNSELHQLGINFLNSLFNKFDNINKPTQYDEINIKKQYKNIDILCIVNNEYSIIIEDKTNTKNHSNQLSRYYKQIEEDSDSTKILPIYFKTGDQSNHENIIENGYQIYLREDFLKVLKSNKIQNNVINEYTDYIQNIEDSINSYKSLPINDWNYDSWKGFFKELKILLNDGNWDYVPNPQGGFLGFWWNWSNNDNFKFYLQINHNIGKIIFKLYTKTDEKIDKLVIDKWKQHIAYNDKNLSIIKPKVVRRGKSATVGILENEFRITNNKNIIDMEETVKFIKNIENIKLEKFKTF
ncbi:MAG: PD-(D/E)XK nuclease family protein [Campylobacterota bacterium]|nr:PD-(D/E)XK nuclease family protein [Campylobacterota bacterium]